MCACLFAWVSVCTRTCIDLVEKDLFQNTEQEVSILHDKNIRKIIIIIKKIPA